MKGFTFIEVLIVLMILGIVLAVSIPSYERYMHRARIVETIAEIETMAAKIKRYEMSKGALPDGLADVEYAGKRDPWGMPYEYWNLYKSKGNGVARKDKKLAPLNSDFDLYSIGRDGLTASPLGNSKSRDDVVRARNGGFIGLAEEFDP